MRKNGFAVSLFLTLTLLLSAFFWTLLIRAGDHVVGLYIEGLMWCPGTAAILTVLFLRLKDDPLGFRWGGARYAFIGYLTPLAYATIGYVAVWSFGFGGFPNETTIKALETKMGWQAFGAGAFVPLFFLLRATTGMVGETASALGEELGWRGFLAPRLVAMFGFTGGELLGGLIWALWHFPIILFGFYHGDAPLWYSIPCFLVFVVAVGVILTWLRLKSNSVWPCAIAHASHNLFIQSFFTPLTAPHGKITAYMIDEFGIAVPVVAVLFAIGFWIYRPRTATN